MKKLLYLFVVTSIFLSSCSKECSTPMDITTAMSKINGYFNENLSDHAVILVGKDETLISDLGQDVIEDFNSTVYIDSLGGQNHPNNLRHTEIINHYYEGTAEFIALPAEIQEAVNIINDLKITGKLKDGVAVEHVIGTATQLDMKILLLHGYGVPLEITPGAIPTYMFMSDDCWTDLGHLLMSVAAAGGGLYAAFFTITSACLAASIWSGPFAVAVATACEMSAMLAELGAASGAVIVGYESGKEVIQDCDL